METTAFYTYIYTFFFALADGNGILYIYILLHVSSVYTKGSRVFVYVYTRSIILGTSSSRAEGKYHMCYYASEHTHSYIYIYKGTDN